jgi:hypothetical protein
LATRFESPKSSATSASDWHRQEGRHRRALQLIDGPDFVAEMRRSERSGWTSDDTARMVREMRQRKAERAAGEEAYRQHRLTYQPVRKR